MDKVSRIYQFNRDTSHTQDPREHLSFYRFVGGKAYETEELIQDLTQMKPKVGVLIGVFRFPFRFEGQMSIKTAIHQYFIMKDLCDAVIYLNSDRIIEDLGERFQEKDPSVIFKPIEDYMIATIRDMVERTGEINIDTQDVTTFIKSHKGAFFAYTLEGDHFDEPLKYLVSTPFLPDDFTDGAQLLLNIGYSRDIDMEAFSHITLRLQDLFSKADVFKIGSYLIDEPGSHYKITLLVNGLQDPTGFAEPTSSYNELYARNKRLEDEITKLKGEQHLVSEALIHAQKSGSEIIQSAKKIALNIHESSKKEGARIVQDALKQVEKIEEMTREAERHYEVVLHQQKVLVHQNVDRFIDELKQMADSSIQGMKQSLLEVSQQALISSIHGQEDDEARFEEDRLDDRPVLQNKDSIDLDLMKTELGALDKVTEDPLEAFDQGSEDASDSVETLGKRDDDVADSMEAQRELANENATVSVEAKRELAHENATVSVEAQRELANENVTVSVEAFEHHDQESLGWEANQPIPLFPEQSSTVEPSLVGFTLTRDICDRSGEVIVPKNGVVTPQLISELLKKDLFSELISAIGL